jgi:hypothetical protein
MLEKVAFGQVFSEYFGIATPFLIPPTALKSSSSGAGTVAPLVADIPSGCKSQPSPPHELKQRAVVPSVDQMEWCYVIFPTAMTQQSDSVFRK